MIFDKFIQFWSIIFRKDMGNLKHNKDDVIQSMPCKDHEARVVKPDEEKTRLLDVRRVSTLLDL